jgi:hypothetical protein
LDGPCLPENDIGWYELVRQHGQELRRGNREAALALAKRIVRARCSNEYWWIRLAESLAELGRIQESIAALEVLHGRGSNAVDATLRRANSPLHRLLSSNIYRRSTLAAKLAADRRALDKRRSEALAKLAGAKRPPEKYVAKHACPFECCVFGKWSVLQTTALYASPGSARVAGQVAKGETVEAITGEVRLRPIPVLVRFPSPHGFTAEEGSIVFLLDYTGEGHGNAWVKGKVFDSEAASVAEQCAFPGAACWGEFILPEDAGRQRDAVWWIKIKTRGGITGWTKEAKHFHGMDKCG